jgi:enoyl-CoA hydratase/carnithine racemase
LLGGKECRLQGGQVMEKRLECRKEDGVAYVWLNRPDKLNALDMQMLTEIRALFNKLQNDQSVRVAVISGRGKAFCAGRDLKEKSDLSIIESLTDKLTGGWGADLYNFTKPVISAINGICLGSGLDIALFSDIRLASKDAVLGYTEVEYGMVVGTGGIQILNRLVGAGEASYMVLTGARIDAKKAKEIGLVNGVYEPEELLPEAEKLASALSKKAPWAMMYSKQILRQGWELTREESMRHDAYVSALLRTTPERREGVDSFKK